LYSQTDYKLHRFGRIVTVLQDLCCHVTVAFVVMRSSDDDDDDDDDVTGTEQYVSL